MSLLCFNPLQWSYSTQSKSHRPWGAPQDNVVSPLALELWHHLWLFHSLTLSRPLYCSLKTPGMPLPQHICIHCSVCLEPRQLHDSFSSFLWVLAQMSFYVWNFWPPYLKEQQHSHTHCVKHVFCFLHFWCFDIWSLADTGHWLTQG